MNKKKKILFILHIPPPVHGSSVIGMQIKNSIKINNEFECHYINLGTSASIDEIGKLGIIKLFRLASIWFFIFIELIIFRPNLCYFAITAKGSAFYKDAFFALLIKIFGINLVYHFHNKGVSTKQDKWLDNVLYRITFKNSTAILLSKYLYEDIQKYFSKDKVYFCSNGLPIVNINNTVLHVKKDKIIVNILFLSNLIESKGVFILLEVCKILHHKQLPFRCTFVGGIGDISEKQFTDNIQKRNIENRVIYLGKKYGIEKESEFAKADIFILPTFNDCLPLVICEAMQHSLPIVSTFEGGIPALVQDGVTGFLVKQKDAIALADKLEILINNPQLRSQMGAAGRKKFEQEFTLHIFENKMTTLLNEILDNSLK